MERMERNFFRMQTFDESNDDVAFWKSLTVDEIFDYAWLLTCLYYRIDPTENIAMDRTAFEMKKNG
jgi:hypothetical protein